MSEESQRLPETEDESINSEQAAVTSEDSPQEEQSQVSQKTQGVRPSRDGSVAVLQTAAESRTNEQPQAVCMNIGTSDETWSDSQTGTTKTHPLK